MSAQKDFGKAVFRLIEKLFRDGLNGIMVSNEDGTYDFYYGKKFTSDMISELAEIAIREVERKMQKTIAESDGVYYTHKFEGPLPEEFDGVFNVLERPYRIEFYADTFRKGIVNLRKQYKV